MKNVLQYVRRKALEFVLRSFTKEIRETKWKNLTQEQEWGMFSQLWETDVIRNWFIKRETELVLSMANRGKKPSDEEYLITYGRRLELMELHDKLKSAYKTMERIRKDELAKRQKDSDS